MLQIERDLLEHARLGTLLNVVSATVADHRQGLRIAKADARRSKQKRAQHLNDDSRPAESCLGADPAVGWLSAPPL